LTIFRFFFLYCIANMLLLGSIAFVSLAARAIAWSLPQKLQDRQDQEPARFCGEIIDEVNEGEF
jgi:hypothetical protein